MQEQVVIEDMVFLSTLVTNIVVVEIEEEGTGVANSANLNCSIVEVVDMDILILAHDLGTRNQNHQRII